ncbi:hypothetical protein [Phytohabitans rumicis]|uniref:Uncharacterized protein n=1 Tax=Phytohabitans rumicis TaxID=1076125 RepID=A0A6V8LCG5_9ACTN|nr:hypothetical protein [Phytohabitans rumicis]GFJ92461.1 hypothetical protein Prum_061030 [Phytohabitans rumicis]
MSVEVNLPEDAVELLARSGQGRAWDVMDEQQRAAARALARDHLRRDWPVLLATLSGFSIGWWHEDDDHHGIFVAHRCGWLTKLLEGEYLANIINGPVAEHRRTGCDAGSAT